MAQIGDVEPPAAEDDIARLVAYYVSSKPLTVADLRAHLAEELLESMIPTHYVCLERMPLTSNGKIDRSVASRADGGKHQPAQDFAAPSTETEKTLAALWCDLLKVESIGRHDNFFGLGGQSLLVMRAVSRMRKTFGVDVQLRNLFERPTVAGLAEVIDGMRWVAEFQSPFTLGSDRERKSNSSLPEGLRMATGHQSGRKLLRWIMAERMKMMDKAWVPARRPGLPWAAEEYELLRDQVRRFVEEEIKPRADRWEEDGFIPRPILRRMGELGFFGIRYPAEYGGAEMDAVASTVFAEELGRSTYGGVADRDAGPYRHGFRVCLSRRDQSPAGPLDAGHYQRRGDHRGRHHGAGCGLGREGHPHARPPRGRLLRPRRHEALHHERRPRGSLLRRRQDRSFGRKQRDHDVPRREGHARLQRRPRAGQARLALLRYGGARLRRLPYPRRERARRGGTGLLLHDAQLPERAPCPCRHGDQGRPRRRSI